MNNYYVYIYLDPRKKGNYKYGSYEFEYEPFYVGKGKGKRWKRINDRTKYFKRILNKIKISKLKSIVIKLKENLNEDDSFILESELINLIGRKDLNKGPLINFTNGGDGMSGYITRKETKENLSKLKRKNFEIIKNNFEKRGYTLLTKEEEYKNCYTKLKYICDSNHVSSITWNNFKSGRICSECNNKKRIKIKFNNLKKKIESKGYKLLTEEKEFKGSRQKLKYICNRNHINFIRCDSIDHSCRKCFYIDRKIHFFNDVIKKKFADKKYILLTNENNYKNYNSKLEYICDKGHKNYIKWANFCNCSKCLSVDKNNEKKINFKNKIKKENKKLVNIKNQLGENNPSSKLTEKDIIKIWDYLICGILTQTDIAKKFNVEKTIISNIKYGKKWKYFYNNLIKIFYYKLIYILNNKEKL